MSANLHHHLDVILIDTYSRNGIKIDKEVEKN